MSTFYSITVELNRRHFNKTALVKISMNIIAILARTLGQMRFDNDN